MRLWGLSPEDEMVFDFDLAEKWLESEPYFYDMKVYPPYPPQWILPDPTTWVRTKTSHRIIKGNQTTVRFYRYLTSDEKYEIVSVAIKTADTAEAQERLYIEMVYLHFVTNAMWANEDRREKARKMLAGLWRVP